MCLIKMNEDVKTRRRKKERIVKFLKMFTLSQIGDRKRRQPMKNRYWRKSKVSLCGVHLIKLGNSDGP